MDLLIREQVRGEAAKSAGLKSTGCSPGCKAVSEGGRARWAESELGRLEERAIISASSSTCTWHNEGSDGAGSKALEAEATSRNRKVGNLPAHAQLEGLWQSGNQKCVT